MNLNLANPLGAVRSGSDSCTSGILAGKRFGAASPDCEKGAEADYGNTLNVFRTEIPHSVKAKESNAEGKSIYADVLNKK